MPDALPILDVIRRRASSRALDSTPVTDDQLHALLEAARWAPSWGNLQPWRFVIVRDEGRRAAIAAACTRGNQWAARAPVLIVVAADPADGKWRGGEPWYLFDCGLATENLLLEAVGRGLIAHPMGGWEEEPVRVAVDAPAGTRIVVLIAVGWPGSLDALDERSREKERRPRERRPLAELAFGDRWGQPLPGTPEERNGSV